MTAITTNKTWIKFVVVIFLIVVGIAGIYYAYMAYVNPPTIEERNDEEILPEAEPGTVYNEGLFPVGKA